MMFTYTEFDNLMLNNEDLKYLRKLKKFGKFIVEDSSIRNRLYHNELVDLEYVSSPGGLLHPSSKLFLSENGKMYFVYRKQRIRKFLFRSIFVPILVAIVTTLITLGLKGLFQ